MVVLICFLYVLLMDLLYNILLQAKPKVNFQRRRGAFDDDEDDDNDGDGNSKSLSFNAKKKNVRKIRAFNAKGADLDSDSSSDDSD